MAAPPAKRQKYQAKDLETKVEILRALKDGVSRQQVMKRYDVKRSTLATYVKNEVEILQAFESEKFNGKRKRLRKAAHPKLEEALLRWIVTARDAQLPLSGPLICAQAEKYALKMKIASFKASEGWFARFKDRHGLVFRNVCGERGAVNGDVIDDWRNVKLREHLATYEPNDIFNADETALFFKALPDKTITLKGDPCTGGKRSKERVTVLLGANMTGTERLPLLVIGKAKKPRCFKNLKQLPVDYQANRKAWMTSEIFRAWLHQLDRRFRAKKRKVLMFVDNCSAHPNVSGLECIQVVFLPPNTTAALQPMDQGVIQYVKSKYRKHVLERMLLCMEAAKEYQVSLLNAIHILSYVWNNTPAEVIANCFKHSGFVRSEARQVVETPDVIEDDDCRFEGVLPAQVHLADYLAIDDGVVAAGQPSDGEIITDALCDDERNSDEDEDSPCEEPPPRRTVREAAEALVLLEEFFYDTSDSASAVEHLTALRKMVVSAKMSSRKQTAITDFFSK